MAIVPKHTEQIKGRKIRGGGNEYTPNINGDGKGHYERNQATPSQQFDWATALYLNACTLRDLGYRLSPEQQARIDKGDPRA
jgi:hypothetical protein